VYDDDDDDDDDVQGEYEQLAKQCQDFAVELLDQTRSSRELEVILNHDSESVAAVANPMQIPVARQPDAVGDHHMQLSRLKLAIKCKQKRVSHVFGLVLFRSTKHTYRHKASNSTNIIKIHNQKQKTKRKHKGVTNSKKLRIVQFRQIK